MNTNRNRIKALNFCQHGLELSLCLTIFSVPISIAMVNIGIGCSFFFWSIRKILAKDFSLPATPINVFLVAIVLLSFLSMLNTINLRTSMGGISKIFKNVFLFLVLVDGANNKRCIKRIILALTAGLALVSFDGIFQYLTGKDFIYGISLPRGLQNELTGASAPRIGASTHGPNDFAIYLVTAIPLLLSLILYSFKGRSKLQFSIIGLMAAFCLFNTHFRGAALGFIVVLALFGLIKKDARFAVVLILLFLALPFLLPKTIIDWSLTHLNPYDFFVEEGGRRLHWQAAINMIKAHPLLGVGVNSFSINYDRYKIPGDPFSGWYAHNTYLHFAADIGLIGLAALFLVLINIILNWNKSYGKIKDYWLKAASLGIFGGFIAFITAGILESSLQSSNLAVLFWFILGLLVSINKLGSSDVNRP
jgi:putative inorganic carbon (HCO3(-)) transporter